MLAVTPIFFSYPQMSEIPNHLRYTKDHEWVKKLEDGHVLVGITHHAQESLGDVTFVELPQPGACLQANDVFGVVESVKAASDLFMPVGGKVMECNEELTDSPEKVNQDPYGEGWMIKISEVDLQSLENLLDADSYKLEVQ